MKNNYIINGILAVAVIVLFVLQFTGKKTDTKNDTVGGIVTDSSVFHLPIAYIRTDSLMVNYKFFNDLNDAIIKKMESQKLVINQRTQKLQKEFVEFQQKAQMTAFISAERQQQEQNRLLGQQQDLENYAAQAEKELALEQMKMNQQLQDTIVAALKIFNTPQKYQFILSNVGTDNIVYADDSYDITKEVIEFLNARYVPSK
jgi:outer membrane protein